MTWNLIRDVPLPLDRPVLVHEWWYGDSVVVLAEYNATFKAWYFGPEQYDLSDATHWMELPQPPAKEEE